MHGFHMFLVLTFSLIFIFTYILRAKEKLEIKEIKEKGPIIIARVKNECR